MPAAMPTTTLYPLMLYTEFASTTAANGRAPRCPTKARLIRLEHTNHSVLSILSGPVMCSNLAAHTSVSDAVTYASPASYIVLVVHLCHKRALEIKARAFATNM